MDLRALLGGVEAHPVEVALRVPFRQVSRRRAVLLHGPAGWGEWSPFPEYDDAYAARWLAAALEAATEGFPAPRRDRVPVNATVPAVAPEEVGELLGATSATTVKVKVAEPGQAHAVDVERVAAVRAHLGPRVRIRVDANAAWSVDEAARRVRDLDGAAGGLEYVEQPVATLDELAELRRRIDTPIAVDESLRRAEDPAAVRLAGIADLVVVKAQPLGGVRRSLDLVERIGLPAVVSSALETSVGLAAGVALAAALPTLDHACGLATGGLLAADVTAEPLVPGPDGALPVRAVAPDPELLAASRPPDDVASAMLARLQRAAGAAGRYV